MQTVALFRSCLREEDRDQIIKMLRAVPDEYARTAYRMQWIDSDVMTLVRFPGSSISPRIGGLSKIRPRTVTIVETIQAS